LVVLIFISAIGMVLSFITHFCSLFHVYNPPRVLAMVLYMGVIIVIYPACIVLKKMRCEFGKNSFKKAVLSVCPRWMLVMTGFLIMYAIVSFIFFFARGSSTGLATNGGGTTGRDLMGFPGHWMALYSFAISIFYSFRCLKKMET